MEMYSGNYKVLHTGSVVTFDAMSGIEMVIKPNVTFSFRLVIEFEENGGDRDLIKEVDESNKTLKIRCLNFERGAGTAEPLELASTMGKKIYLHLWVERVSENNFIRRVDYTVFTER